LGLGDFTSGNLLRSIPDAEIRYLCKGAKYMRNTIFILLLMCITFSQKSYSQQSHTKDFIKFKNELENNVYSVVSVYEVIGKSTVKIKVYHNTTEYNAYGYWSNLYEIDTTPVPRDNSVAGYSIVDNSTTMGYSFPVSCEGYGLLSTIHTKITDTIVYNFDSLPTDRRVIGIQEISSTVKNNQKMPGVVIGDVMKKSLAEKAGIKVRDIIIKFNNHNISAFSDLTSEIAKAKPRKKIPIKVFRGSKEYTFYIEFDK
jgi:membrane-associated protease RseP (regulator of RpoE activity)